MTQLDVDNGALTDLPLSFGAPLGDGARPQRVESIQADDTPVALTATQARWTVSSTTISLATKLSGVANIDYVLFVAQVADMLFWFDGKDPVTTPGDVLSAGYPVRLSGGMLANFKVVRATVDAIGIVHAFRRPAT